MFHIPECYCTSSCPAYPFKIKFSITGNTLRELFLPYWLLNGVTVVIGDLVDSSPGELYLLPHQDKSYFNMREMYSVYSELLQSSDWTPEPNSTASGDVIHKQHSFGVP